MSWSWIISWGRFLSPRKQRVHLKFRGYGTCVSQVRSLPTTLQKDPRPTRGIEKAFYRMVNNISIDLGPLPCFLLRMSKRLGELGEWCCLLSAIDKTLKCLGLKKWPFQILWIIGSTENNLCLDSFLINHSHCIKVLEILSNKKYGTQV